MLSRTGTKKSGGGVVCHVPAERRTGLAAFGLDPDGAPGDLKVIDRRMLRTEQRDLMPPPAVGERRDDVEPFAFHVTQPWRPERARWLFLSRFAELTLSPCALAVTTQIEGEDADHE